MFEDLSCEFPCLKHLAPYKFNDNRSHVKLLRVSIGRTFYSSCRALRYVENYSSYLANDSLATPFTLKLPDNRTLVTRDHVYPLDDLYCFVNGWYSITDRSQAAKNYSYMEEVSEKACEGLEGRVPGYFELSAIDLARETFQDVQFLKDIMAHGSEGNVTQEVIDRMYLHTAFKCLLRGL